MLLNTGIELPAMQLHERAICRWPDRDKIIGCEMTPE
jgi:hypothetical protein